MASIGAAAIETPSGFRRPPPLLFATEPLRAGTELLHFGVSLPLLLGSPLVAGLPRGDGRPVLVLPGFTASDFSTEPLRRLLCRLGWTVVGWDLGRNLGPTPRVVAGVQARLASVAERCGAPVTVIGWSLGGIYARALAHRHPELVRHVITLGSPFRVSSPADTSVGRVFDALSGLHVDPDVDPLLSAGFREPPPVPCTSVYTRRDGVVPWESCVEAAVDGGTQLPAACENVEVHGSHMGLGLNPAALLVVADRLRLAADAWAPFVPPRGFASLFPAQRR